MLSHLVWGSAPITVDPTLNELTEQSRSGMSEKKVGKNAPKADSPAPRSKIGRKTPPTKSADGVVLLTGGNPQIAKGYGNAPVQQYIAAMPGWKSDLGKRLDRLVVKTVPGVEKAVKWNSPFYGVEKDVWFLSFHCMTKYVKVAFFRGAQFSPLPPGTSKQPDVRYLDIYETDELDEAQFMDWVKQASELPGEKM